jgi:hypothetical protein
MSKNESYLESMLLTPFLEPFSSLTVVMILKVSHICGYMTKLPPHSPFPFGPSPLGAEVPGEDWSGVRKRDR